MFQWDKSINAINIPASKIVNLFRSMREVQLALPGISAQEASAYLCQYRTEAGVATVAVFHLLKSRILAFYRSDPQVVSPQQKDSMLDQGLNLVESMGFLMTDQDIHLLDDKDQEMLWASLPLKAGLKKEEVAAPVVSSPAKEPVQKPVAKLSETKAAQSSNETRVSVSTTGRTPTAKVVPVAPPEAVAQKPEAVDDNVDDLLAAVEALRAKRPGLRARKSPPSPEEMERRRKQLRENIGRILASL